MQASVGVSPQSIIIEVYPGDYFAVVGTVVPAVKRGGDWRAGMRSTVFGGGWIRA